MNRRRILSAALAFPSPMPATAALQPAPAGFARTFRDSFARHWADTREYTLAVLDAMPEEGFASKPHPAQRTFAEQLVHLALANVAYFRAFALLDPPERANPTTKSEVRAYVVGCFDYVAAVLNKLTESDLLRNDLVIVSRLPPHSAIDIFLRAYMHTAHHRGQLIVYLRVQGIVPPTWKFEPSTR
jgi:uncharacterized damage-inducible protein DinB